MADGLSWDDLPVEFTAPGTEIRRRDGGGLAICHIRLAAGTHTAPVFAGLPDDRCPYPHWGHVMSGTIRVHRAAGAADYTAGESYYWEPGHNLEAVSDVEYLEITPVADYDALMAHARRSG